MARVGVPRPELRPLPPQPPGGDGQARTPPRPAARRRSGLCRRAVPGPPRPARPGLPRPRSERGRPREADPGRARPARWLQPLMCLPWCKLGSILYHLFSPRLSWLGHPPFFSPRLHGLWHAGLWTRVPRLAGGGVSSSRPPVGNMLVCSHKARKESSVRTESPR